MNQSTESQAAPSSSLWVASLLVGAAMLHFLAGMGADPDLWAHVHYGGMILDGHGLPREDIFSYSAPGATFYDHEWLADLVFTFVWRSLGAVGLVGLKLLISVFMLVALLDATRTLRRELLPQRHLEPLLTAALLVLVLAVVHPGATFRPQLFTMLFLAIELALLARADMALRGPRGSPGWCGGLVPVLLAVWANFHGGFLVGVGLLGLWGGVALLRVLGPTLRRLLPPRTISRGESGGALAAAVQSAGSFSFLAVVGIVAICLAGLVAPLLNPYGFELYLYLWRTLGMHGEISEWEPVAFGDTNFLRYHILIALTATASLVLLRWTPVGRRGGVLVWLVPMTLLGALYGYRHQRHTVLFAELSVPLLLVGAEALRARLVASSGAFTLRAPARTAIAAGMAGLALVQMVSFGAQLARDGIAVRFGRLDYPVDAVSFLQRHGFSGNMAVPFEWGAYVIYKLGDQSRVFMDGRFEAVYPPQVIDDYFRFMTGTKGWERVLDSYPTDVVVVQRWRNIHPRLFARDDLEYVYSDPAALVFVRRSNATQAALERLALVEERNDFPRYATVFP